MTGNLLCSGFRHGLLMFHLKLDHLHLMPLALNLHLTRRLLLMRLRLDLYLSDFSLPSLLRNLSPLGQLCRSTASIPTPELVNE